MEFRKRGFSGTLNPEPSRREGEHRALARRAAAESMVLLQNDGVLPLASGTPVALYGMGARYTIQGGTGSGSVNSRETVSIDHGLRSAGLAITTDDWLNAFDASYAAARAAWQEEILAAATVRLREWIRDAVSGRYSSLKLVIFGPFEAPVYKVQGVYRNRLVIKCRLNKKEREFLGAILTEFGRGAGKKLTVSADLNPSTL